MSKQVYAYAPEYPEEGTALRTVPEGAQPEDGEEWIEGAACAECGALVLPNEYHPIQACELIRASAAFTRQMEIDGQNAVPLAVVYAMPENGRRDHER